MESLKEAFQQVHTQVSRLVEKVAQGIFLEEEEIHCALEHLMKLEQEQKRCVTALGLEGKGQLSLDKLQEIHRQQQEREARLSELRSVVQTFLRIRYRGEDTNCQQELETLQRRMEQYTDTHLFQMDSTQELEYYRQFNALISGPVEYQNALNLTAYFGYPLTLALLGQQLTCEVQTKSQSLPLDGTSEISDQPVESSISHSQTADEQPTPPPSDLARLGNLKIEHSGKERGNKVFERLFKDPVTSLCGRLVLDGLYHWTVYCPDVERWDDPSIHAGILSFLEKLYKEGFVQRNTLEFCPGVTLYGLSRAGLDNIKKKSVQSLIRCRCKTCCAGQLHSAADFVRLYYGQELFGRLMKYHPELCANYWEKNGYALVDVRREKDGPIEGIFIPAALYTAGDVLEDLEACIQEELEHGATGMAFFVASLTLEESRGWAEYLHKRIAKLADCSIRCGVVGEDGYTDGQEISYSFRGYIEQLCRKGNEQSNAPAEWEIRTEDEPQDMKPLAHPLEQKEESIQRETVQPATEPEQTTGHALEDSTAELLPQDIHALARLLLDHPEQMGEQNLLQLTARLIAERQLAAAATLAEILAKAPSATPVAKHFYRAFRQSMQIPGETYCYTSNVMDELQNLLPEEEGAIKGLQQTMILAIQLWGMLFPTNAFDHDLYHNATMVLNGAVEQYLEAEMSDLRSLMDLLRTDLRELSFRRGHDGLGFSSDVLNKLANDGERKRRMEQTRKWAKELLRVVPTSTVRISGLETCLKSMVGRSSSIGEMIHWISEDDRDKGQEMRRRLACDFELSSSGVSDASMEWYIDACWNEVRHQDSEIKLKRLDNDTPARKVCKKALSERISVIAEWLTAVEAEQNSAFLKNHREDYARIQNQVSHLLRQIVEALAHNQAAGWVARAGRVLLGEAICRILERLHNTDSSTGAFYQPLAWMPELLLDEHGAPEVIRELYQVRGVEPWIPLLEGLAREPESSESLLAQIDDYQSRWYRNYGTEALLRSYGYVSQEERPDSVLQMAKEAAIEGIKQFKSEIRLSRAYGKIREHLMETVFSVLDMVQEYYFRVGNFGSFAYFMTLLNRQIEREIQTQTLHYQKRVTALKETEEYADAPIFDAIERALKEENFVQAEAYINRLQNGEQELTVNEQVIESEKDFFAQFQSCEEAYYQECYRHKGAQPGNWGYASLKDMGVEYQNWTSSNESKNAETWLKNWVLVSNTEMTQVRVKALINGLGFQVEEMVRKQNVSSAAEVFELRAKKTSTSLKDYSHPVYKFGTDLSDPMYVVCLYGCKGATTVIHVMTHELQLNGSTIVLMDGSLTAADRRKVADEFKSDTSRQSPFLLIDRVLLLYLASLDQGDRLRAMLRCTLPYTFELLYGNGTGPVQEEMFIGRVGEMNDLRNLNGPMLVYGGRQLGKTALLNRASKTLHHPEQKEYSFCVDVKDEGSEALLERLNDQLLRLKLIPHESTTIRELCQMLANAYEDGVLRQLRIFVDEVDCLFEEFKTSKFEAARPFIVLSDQTNSHVKFVFAGTHNVADTSTAEEENNNLIHMGVPLCIEPLSPDDAIRLICRPLSYLGFKIGEAQIELIVFHTNSYPGLIHMFCNALIQSISRDYKSYYSQAEPGQNPPYQISDEQMKAVFKEKDIRKEIGKRVMATISLNQKYHVVSCMLAHIIYEEQEQGKNRLYGYSAEELLEYNRREFKIGLLLRMELKDLVTLLNEMVKMGILWKTNETDQFRFRQQDFLSYIGTHDYVIGKLLEVNEGENADAP